MIGRLIVALFIYIAVVGLPFFVLLRKRKAKAQRHVHKRKAIAVQHFSQSFPPVTSVLLGCACGEVSTLTTMMLYGTWSIAELAGEDPEVSELRRIMATRSEA
jgi:hypothetical protein